MLVYDITLYLDLFQRAIIQSGSGLCDWAVDYNPVEHAIRIAKKVNCTSTKIKEISECLRKASPYDIIIAHSSFLVSNNFYK